MLQILELRDEAARLLGYQNYSEKSLSMKMAESPDQVMDFLTDLANRAKPQAEKEMLELKAFAKAELGLDEVQPWDLAFVSEKLRQQAYQLSQEDVKPYFPVDNVIKGLFDLVYRLFGITIQERSDIDTWHPDVRFYDIRDESGQLRGQFYFDLYARQNKRGGAWMDECINRMHHQHQLQTPVAYLTCNSTPPAGGKPALFTHDEVTTLFHEFGHGLQHMLTTIDYPEVSGINGVEWDAVELPSQFMENWCWEKEALNLFARHFESGEVMPNELFDRMNATRHFQAAMQMLRQIEFAMFDMRMHSNHDLVMKEGIQQLLDEVREEVSVIIPPDWNRFQHGFSHIFAGGYAAGYYSYKWAEVLSADAFSRFEEEGLFNEQVGKDFLHTVLEQGGSRKAMEVYKEFRGREPSIDALLRHNGLAA
jgi:oligopeptidase A